MGGAGSDQSQSSNVSSSNNWSRNNSRGLNRSSSFGNTDSVSGSNVWGAQSPFLTGMYGQAAQYANPAATQAAATRAAAGMAPDLGNAFTNTAGLTDPTSQIAAQEASLSEGLGRMFQNEMMPAIGRGAQSRGGFGGGRQGVAEGVAAGELASAYTEGLGDITARANQTALGASALMPSMAQAVFANAVNPTMAGLDPLGQMSSIIGGPSILSQSQSTGRSGSRGFGRTRSRGRSAGSSQGQSSSSSESWDFNLMSDLLPF